MRQLEPVGEGKLPIYADNCPEFRDWVSCFIELHGMHRFRDDPEWGELLMRFRDGTLTEADIDKINQRVVSCSTSLPENIRYATFFNRDRDSINAGLFQERSLFSHDSFGHTQDEVIVFASNVQVQNSSKTYTDFSNCTTFWENC